MGWAGWVMLARRAAPWGLLIFVAIQIKTLSDRVRQVEDHEFSQVQTEVQALRQELLNMRTATQAAEHDLAETASSLKTVNASLEQARKGAPQLGKTIAEAHLAGDAVKVGLPSADDAAELARALKTAGTRVAGVVSGLPTAETGTQLAGALQAANRAVADDVGQATALGAALDAQQKKIDAMGKQLDDDTALLASVKSSLPSEEQLQTLKRELVHAHDVVAHAAPDTKSPEPRSAEGSGAHAAQ